MTSPDPGSPMSRAAGNPIRYGVNTLRRLTWRQRWWCVENWWKGYRFDPIGRCRFCDHTTPHHYSTCRLSERARELADD